VVTDNLGLASAAAQVTVTVSPAANQAPVANAGANLTLTLPTSSTPLAGSGTDADGTISTYTWSQVSGPSTATFSSKTVAAPTISQLVAGSYVFSLVVTDNLGLASAPAQVTVTVNTCQLATPTVVTPLTYCVNSSAKALSTSVTLANGATLVIYTAATGTTTVPATFQPSTSVIGSTTYYVSQTMGNCESSRVAIVVNVMAPPTAPVVVPAAGISSSNMAAWGDSFTHAEYGVYPQTLGQLSGYSVYDGGIGGETSVQIRDRMLADTQKHSWPTIIWAGRNDSDKPDQVKASIAAMVASLPHKNYLVLGICNGSGEGTGTYGYAVTTTLNNGLAAIYGNHFIDIRAFLVSQYDPTNAQDVADHAADIPPTSLRQDFLHPNVAGCTLIGNYLYAHIDQLLSANYCAGSQADLPSNCVKPVAGTTLLTYTTATGGTPMAANFRPSTATVGNTTYYLAQAVGSCESPRTAFTVNVMNCSSSLVSTSTTAYATASVLDAKSALRAATVLEVAPNPTSEQTTVSFSLAQAQPYTLDLYDATGRLVQHLAQGDAEAGLSYRHSVDASSLGEGLYILRLVAGNASKTTPLMVRK
ncbi:T9SS type A sorting domain-containing protein, partial [Hymenobacter sp. HMF4947]